MLSASNHEFGWSLGDVNIYYNFNKEIAGGGYAILKFNITTTYGLTYGLTIFENWATENVGFKKCVILPVEVSYSPWTFMNPLYPSIYGKFFWQFEYGNNEKVFLPDFSKLFSYVNRPNASFGLRLALLFNWKFNYTPSFDIYLEYSLSNEFKIGFTLDIGVLGVVILGGWKEDVESEKQNVWEKKPEDPNKKTKKKAPR
jgi:hypothetical protein